MKRPMPLLPLLIAALLLVTASVLSSCTDLTDSTTAPTGVGTTTTTTTTLPVTTSATPTSGVSLTTDGPLIVGTMGTIHLDTVPDPAFTNRYEENNPLIKWTGSWTFTGGAKDSGGSCRYTDSAGAALTVKFKGVSCALITRTGLAVGKIKVTLDSNPPFYIDCYSATPQYKVDLVIGDFLDDATHYVRLECAGTANPASGGTGIYIDAFAITGVLQAQ